MGGAKRNPGYGTLRAQAPDGAQEDKRMIAPLQHSDVGRAFIDGPRRHMDVWVRDSTTDSQMPATATFGIVPQPLPLRGSGVIASTP